ncbi:hypothetical protein SteCoe_17034 [Stentor coeruleus]|uniref:RING-type domain-containing protein n=1 Tax=Stentor coeruleus TaxID=5963 RepID=A0A1R2BZZ2_9CILI|nr:hypothetical protein SteCoe_17034 [Stentor coeruleus]
MDRDMDLAIKIPADVILKEFECPVCFGTIKDACVTKCGHLFCKDCIDECLNRRHECPNCKHETTIEEVIRNFSLDTIIKILLQEREKAATEHYESMFNAAKIPEAHTLNPIETVFHTNMKESFVEFEKYFRDLKDRTERSKSKLRAQFSGEELEKNFKELDENLSKSIEMIVESFDKHMKSISLPPELLPVRIFLKAPKKNLTLDMHIPRTHTTKDLLDIIINYYISKGDPVQSLSNGNFVLHMALSDGDIIILDNGPIGKYSIIQGSTIYFDGEIVLKSDAPKECFTKNYVKGQGMKCNYYHCFTCNTNWICEPCSQACHQGHNTSIAIPSHVPTWACCYCVKKGLCRIPNKDKK